MHTLIYIRRLIEMIIKILYTLPYLHNIFLHINNKNRAYNKNT